MANEAGSDKPQFGTLRQLNARLERVQQTLADPPQDPANFGAWLEFIRTELQSSDVSQITLDAAGSLAQVIFIETLVDRKRLFDEVLRPLEERPRSPSRASGDPRAAIPAARATRDASEVLSGLLRARVAILLAGAADVYLIEVEAKVGRQVTEATTEPQSFGPKEAFVENLDVNLNLLRRRLATADLRVQVIEVGRRSHTRVAVLSVDGIAPPERVSKVTQAIDAIDVDYVRSADEVSDWIVSRKLTPFPLSEETERPMNVVSGLLTGRVAIVADGSPFAILVPTSIVQFQHDGELSLNSALLIGFVRWLRLLGAFIAVTAPALYAAFLSVDPEVLPTELVINVAASRAGVPYPVMFESLIFLFIADIVIEASQQSPPGIAQSLTIVGSLIVGQAAVAAQLASNLMVIVVALTTIGTLLTLSLPMSYAIRFIKYPLVLISGAFGIFGFMLGLIAITVHLASLESFGMPYLSPLGPIRWRDLRLYSVLAGNKVARRVRPRMYDPVDQVRAAPHQEEERL